MKVKPDLAPSAFDEKRRGRSKNHQELSSRTKDSETLAGVRGRRHGEKDTGGLSKRLIKSSDESDPRRMHAAVGPETRATGTEAAEREAETKPGEEAPAPVSHPVSPRLITAMRYKHASLHLKNNKYKI